MTGADASFLARIAEKAMVERGFLPHPSPQALAELAKVGFDPVFGARPLKRAIQQRIENPLSKLLLEGKFLPKDTVQVSVDPVLRPGEFDFKVVTPAK